MSEEKAQVQDLRERVKAGVEGSNAAVFDGVVSHLVGEEADRRKKLILRGLAEVEKCEKELQKIRGDKRFDLAGAVVSETFGPKEIQERKKITDRIGKISNALDRAFGGDYQKLNDVCQGGQAQPQAEEPAAE